MWSESRKRARPEADLGGPLAQAPFASGLLARLPSQPRKVVILRASRIGDFLCATPTFRALRAALPVAQITLIALPFVRELVERLPSLDRFVPFPGFPGIAEQFFDARAATRFFCTMQAEWFDLAIQLHGSGVYANPFTLLLGARVTAGFIRPGDSPGRLDAALPLAESGHEHEIERTLAMTRFLGAPDRGIATELPLRPEDYEAADALLGQIVGPLIALHPTAREATKCWPTARFAALGQALLAECGGTLLVVGGSDAHQPAAEISAQIGPGASDLSGRTSLPTLAALLTRCEVLVTNDSGPAHVAYAVGAPTVTLFGETDPGRWGPIGPGPHRVLDGRGEIDGIAVRDVLNATLATIGHRTAAAAGR